MSLLLPFNCPTNVINQLQPRYQFTSLLVPTPHVYSTPSTLCKAPFTPLHLLCTHYLHTTHSPNNPVHSFALIQRHQVNKPPIFRYINTINHTITNLYYHFNPYHFTRLKATSGISASFPNFICIIASCTSSSLLSPLALVPHQPLLSQRIHFPHSSVPPF